MKTSLLKWITLTITLMGGLSIYAYDAKAGKVYYNIDKLSKSAEVTYKNSDTRNSYSGEVVIPDSIRVSGVTYAVTKIGDNAFCDCRSVSSVSLPKTLTAIGKRAFWGCTGITTLNIPESVDFIGDFAFYCVNNVLYYGPVRRMLWGAKCMDGYVEEPFIFADETKTILLGCVSSAEGEIEIPNSVKEIGEYAFCYCVHITSIKIPASVKGIGKAAFWYCRGLSSITFPNSVMIIEEQVCEHCYGLTSISFNNSVKNIKSKAFGGCSGLTTITIPNSVTKISMDAFQSVNHIIYYGRVNGAPWGAKCMNGYVENFFIYADASKSTIMGCFGAIQGDIALPHSVKHIGDEAFQGCRNLTSIKLPTALISIGNRAFDNCRSLTTMLIPNSVTKIGKDVFKDCENLTAIIVPNPSLERFKSMETLSSYNVVGENNETPEKP